MKRKRGKGFTTAAAVGRTPKQLRPLVDYEDDDDELGNIASSSKLDKTSSATSPNETSLSPKRDWFAGLQNEGPLSPSLLVSKGQTEALNPFDEDKSMVDKTLTNSPPRLGEKRRRDEEDDEDELLERLVRSKRPSVGASADTEDSPKVPPKIAAAPGKMKLKLGPTILSLGSPSSFPSQGESSEKEGSDG